MRIKIFSFTDNGRKLAGRIAQTLEDSVTVADEKKVSRKDFESEDALIFIGAAGIAVRLTAPFVSDKLTDPAVLVIDEKASFVIPILSGHVGGANELGCMIAEMLGAIPVITTATDVNGVIAVDELAEKNNLKIVGRDNIKKVSMGLMSGKPVNISLDDDVVITGSDSDIDERVLGLLYAPIVVGMGMRRGTDPDKLDAFFRVTLKEHGLSPEDVSGLATIDVKKDEEALAALSEKYRLPLYFYSAEELNQVEGDFAESEFVLKTVGTADVSARAAKALGRRGSFILKKKREDGMTISVFKKYRRVTFEY